MYSGRKFHDKEDKSQKSQRKVSDDVTHKNKATPVKKSKFKKNLHNNLEKDKKKHRHNKSDSKKPGGVSKVVRDNSGQECKEFKKMSMDRPTIKKKDS